MCSIVATMITNVKPFVLVSNFIIQEIKRREEMYESMLCDISHKFFLANNNDGIMMSLENLQGLQKLAGSADTVVRVFLLFNIFKCLG